MIQKTGEIEKMSKNIISAEDKLKKLCEKYYLDTISEIYDKRTIISNCTFSF